MVQPSDVFKRRFSTRLLFLQRRKKNPAFGQASARSTVPPPPASRPPARALCGHRRPPRALWAGAGAVSFPPSLPQPRRFPRQLAVPGPGSQPGRPRRHGHRPPLPAAPAADGGGLGAVFFGGAPLPAAAVAGALQVSEAGAAAGAGERHVPAAARHRRPLGRPGCLRLTACLLLQGPSAFRLFI